jgi:hypothetical protein
MDRWDLLYAAGTLMSIFLPLIIVVSGKQCYVGKAVLCRESNGEQRKRSRARRMAEHRMNARLLRLNI